MALFIDVARGHDEVIAERRRWLEPFWPQAEFAEYTGRGLLAEHALWQGDAETALAEIDAALKAEADESEDYGPPVIRLAETGRREDAQREWDKAARVAGQLGAVPLRSALDDLARRARLGHGPAPGWAGGRPGRLAGLTSREREVLRLIVAGRSNREIGAA